MNRPLRSQKVVEVRKIAKPSFVILCFLLLIGCHSISKKALVQTPPHRKPIFLSKEGPITASDLGVPIYPGATASKGMIARGSIQTASVTFYTSDSVKQVEDFYLEKLGTPKQLSTEKSGKGNLTDVDMEFVGKNKKILMEIMSSPKKIGTIYVVLTQSYPSR
jgi:hypothetical protein